MRTGDSGMIAGIGWSEGGGAITIGNEFILKEGSGISDVVWQLTKWSFTLNSNLPKSIII